MGDDPLGTMEGIDEKIGYAGIIGSLVLCMSALIACAQPDKKALLKEETEAQSLKIFRME